MINVPNTSNFSPSQRARAPRLKHTSLKNQNIKLLIMVNDFTRPPKMGLEKESPFEETEGLVRKAGWMGRAVRES